MMHSTETHRLFFALWPTDQVREAIFEEYSQLAAQWPIHMKGHIIRPENLHVTLHFIGQVKRQAKDCMHQAAQSVSAKAFRFDLDCFDYFCKARIFWMGPRCVPVELVRLHDALGTAIEGCGFKPENRPYLPHLTLMRKCSKPGISHEQADFTIPWQVENFALVESIPTATSAERGVNYQVIEKYPLS